MRSSQTAHGDNCTLVVESRIDAKNALVLHYTFQNSSGHDVYLFNRLYKNIEDGPVFDTQPNLVNIELLPRGILLSKKIIAVPPPHRCREASDSLRQLRQIRRPPERDNASRFTFV